MITLRSGKGYEGPKNPMVEDNDTKENGPNLGRNMELEKELEKLKETIVSKENEKYANPLPFPTALQKQRVWDLQNTGSVEAS